MSQYYISSGCGTILAQIFRIPKSFFEIKGKIVELVLSSSTIKLNSRFGNASLWTRSMFWLECEVEDRLSRITIFRAFFFLLKPFQLLWMFAGVIVFIPRCNAFYASFSVWTTSVPFFEFNVALFFSNKITRHF